MKGVCPGPGVLLRAIPNPVWGGRTDAGPGVLEDAAEVIRTYVSLWSKLENKGASITCDATAVMIGSCPLGGGLGRRVSGAEWIARDPMWVVCMKPDGPRCLGK